MVSRQAEQGVKTGHRRIGTVSGQVTAGVVRLVTCVLAGCGALRGTQPAAPEIAGGHAAGRRLIRGESAGPPAVRPGRMTGASHARRHAAWHSRIIVAGPIRRRVAWAVPRPVALDVRRAVIGRVRPAVSVRAGHPEARSLEVGDTGGRRLEGVRRHLVREWPGRKRRNVGFRGSRDEFGERPAGEERRIFPGGVTSVFRLALARLRSRLGRIRRPGKVTGPHVRPATAAKLIPRGNGMPVIASPHRSPLSVPAVDHPPCQRADIRAFQPGPQTG